MQTIILMAIPALLTISGAMISDQILRSQEHAAMVLN